MSLDTKHIIDLYNKGFSFRAIAKIDGRAANTIRKIILDNKIPIRSRSAAIRKFPTELAIVLYNLGLSAQQVGDILGVDQSTVVKRFSTINFPMRTRNVANDIGFSDEEYRQFFLTDVLLDLIAKSI